MIGASPLQGLSFDWRERIVTAQRILSEPPAREHIERPVARGTLVKRFALPLDLCKPFNRLSRAGSASARWSLGKLKKDAYELMLAQYRERRSEPLTGRPQVLCVRFSSVEPDHESGWCKNPVDRLRVGKNGLGIIFDDKPRCIELRTWWEPAKRGEGFVFVEVRS